MAVVFLVSSYSLRVSHCEVISPGESEDANANTNYCPLNESRENLDVDYMAAGCTVRYGRPDLEDIIGAVARKTIGNVIIAANGTDELVKATRMAATTVSKGHSTPSIRFVGVESKW